MTEGGVRDQRNQRTFQFTEVRLDVGGEENEDFVVDFHSFAEAAVAQHLKAGLVRRLLEFHAETPFEPRKEPVLEVLQVNRSTVRSEDELLSVLVQMVEHVEEGVLRSDSEKILDIVHDKDVYLHVEGQEVGKFVPDVHRVHVLGLELVAGDVEHNQVGMLLRYGKTYRLCEVGLSESGTSENEKRVEKGAAGGVGDILTGGDAHSVAFSLDKVVEVVDGIESGVDLYPLHSGEDERSGIAFGGIGVDRDGLVHRSDRGCGRICHRLFVLHDRYPVHETGSRSDHPLEGFLQKVEVNFLEILAEKVRFYFDRKGLVLEGKRLYGLEPYLEFLRLNDLLNDPQTIIPNDYVFVCVHKINIAFLLKLLSLWSREKKTTGIVITLSSDAMQSWLKKN